MNILYCGDQNVEKGLFLSAISLRNHTATALNIYILTASIDGHKPITESFTEKLREALRDKNKKSQVYLFDISEFFLDYMPLANMDTRFTPFCMLRLFADKVPEIPSRILYLDTDVMCRRYFYKFYNLNISAVEIAGAADRYGKRFFGNIILRDYLNSGVLLLNMDNIRKSGLFEKCREMCRNKKMLLPDQAALNKLAKKRKVNRRYNEQGPIRRGTVFKHFNTYFKFTPYIHPVTIKPWDEDLLHTTLKIFEFDDILNEYKRRFHNDN